MRIFDIPFTPDNLKYRDVYKIWRMYLIERVMDIFQWEGHLCPSSHHIEENLMLTGKCGIAEYEGELVAFHCNLYGQTVYYDEFKKMNVFSPIYTNTVTLGENGVCIFNNATHTSVWKLIHLYSAMLAHTTVTYILSCINLRENNMVITSRSNQDVAYNIYRKAIVDGVVKPVSDPSLFELEIKDLGTKRDLKLIDIYEVIGNILNDFYSFFGVRTVYRKKGNLISNEVVGETPKLLINVKSMTEQREKGCEQIKKVFGYDWNVTLAKEISDFIPEIGGNLNDTKTDTNGGRPQVSKGKSE